MYSDKHGGFMMDVTILLWFDSQDGDAAEFYVSASPDPVIDRTNRHGDADL
jgi:predicted 3-demethylubiquinone-9 3-methyltransferase (glyoxalase superfamily)